MKKFVLIFILLMTFFSVHAQNVVIKVVDSGKNIVPYATVAILTRPDSTLVDGAVTDSLGLSKFNIETSKLGNCFAVISMLGYDKAIINNINEGVNDVEIKESSLALQQVVVTAQRPIAKMDNEGLVISTKGTAISKIGRAIDMLAQIPMISVDHDGIKVLGRGKPLIYIDGKQLRNMTELQTIASSQIASVKVITHPGSEYDSSVLSVVKITTIRKPQNGLGGSVFFDISSTPNISSKQYVYLQYQNDKLEIFGSLYNTYKSNNQHIESEMQFQKNADTKVIESVLLKLKNDNLTSVLGANYAINKKNQLGIKYLNSTTLYDRPEITDDVKSYSERGLETVQYTQKQKQTEGVHHVNMYYSGELASNYSLRIDGDLMKTNSTNNNSVQKGNNPDMISDYKNQSDFQSLRVKNIFGVLKGEMTIGFEFFNTVNKQQFNANNRLENANNKMQNIGLAGFLSYSYSFNNFSTMVGLRYEQNGFKYYDNGVIINEQSKMYRDFFPLLAISYSGPVNINLSYRSSIQRPSYNQLRSNVQYNNAYSYEGGNPYLKPALTHEVSLDILKNNFMMGVQFAKTKNHIFYDMSLYKGNTIAFFQHKNVDDIKMLSVYASYRRSISIWTPDIYVAWSKPFLNINGQNFNTPTWQLSFKNSFHLAKNTYLYSTYNYTSSGNNKEIMLFEKSHQLDFHLSQRFMDGKLVLGLKATDILNTNKTGFKCYKNDINMSYTNKADTRGVYFSVQYNFNNKKKRYNEIEKSDEMNRL